MANKLKAVREKLRISQEAAAQLLGVSLKSVYRWENAKEFKSNAGNDAILELLPILAEGKVPEACRDARKHGLDTSFLADHVGGCADCRLVFVYLYNAMSKFQRRKLNARRT